MPGGGWLSGRTDEGAADVTQRFVAKRVYYEASSMAV
jgi:hypothetical protein